MKVCSLSPQFGIARKLSGLDLAKFGRELGPRLLASFRWSGLTPRRHRWHRRFGSWRLFLALQPKTGKFGCGRCCGSPDCIFRIVREDRLRMRKVHSWAIDKRSVLWHHRSLLCWVSWGRGEEFTFQYFQKTQNEKIWTVFRCGGQQDFFFLPVCGQRVQDGLDLSC